MTTTNLLLILLGGLLLGGISHTIDCHIELKRVRRTLEKLEKTGRLWY